jgi:tetratricopeptide (TPR) repeat protein
MTDLMNRLLNIEGYEHNVGMFNYDDFEMYQDNQLVNGNPIDPLVYVVLGMIFTIKGSALGARKAILMANRCYAGDATNFPPVATHGKPRRTAVLNLIRGSIFFYEFGLVTLGNAAYTLAVESDKAVTAKAMARGMFADTVSYVRHLLKKGECYFSLYSSGDVMKALEIANECVVVSVAGVDNCQAWLLVAKVLSITQHDMVSLMDAYASAVHTATGSSTSKEVGSVENFTIPLRDILAYSKTLITAGGSKYNEALRLLIGECTTRCTSASLFLYIGICCLRLELLADAEDAFQEANLLENRNGDIWAYLSLFILATGSMHRIEEAEKSMAQALRLGLNNSTLLRELAISFMSIDKFVIAEELVRRSLAIETGVSDTLTNGGSSGTLATTSQQGGAPTSRGNAHTRKLMGDILAAQNQAVKAIAEYQGVISDMEVEASIRIAAGEKCHGLLVRLGRDDEAKQLASILNQLNSQ